MLIFCLNSVRVSNFINIYYFDHDCITKHTYTTMCGDIFAVRWAKYHHADVKVRTWRSWNGKGGRQRCGKRGSAAAKWSNQFLAFSPSFPFEMYVGRDPGYMPSIFRSNSTPLFVGTGTSCILTPASCHWLLSPHILLCQLSSVRISSAF